ncbi:hypothetical protein ASPCAL09174 [Aspergillus calidoustus]|uniref:Uncharacterized protein n=1 Tax=Aspergillus calidoustus TaxID=454130 RepID=A0A0U5CRE9_ASPCI|nr:hypothetical protein ASPCAL09174 [Aspergillus calidoustus]
MSASVLGESWVVPSVRPEKEDVASRDSPETPKQVRCKGGSNHGSESVTSSTSSVSGPELIMPSIYETPISEASWVAPNLRSEQTSPLESSPFAAPVKAKETFADVPNQDAHSTTTSKDQTPTRLRLLETPIQTIINIVLIAAIAHLLVLPEFVQQYQILCGVGPILTLYPSSCSAYDQQRFSPHQRHQSKPHTAVTTSQSRLESLFNTTLHEIAPLNGSLKQTESLLRTVERELKRAHPGTKHELDLEFESCWRAIRIAGWKFDSLKVDLQSAVDSLVAAGDVKPTTDSGSSVAQGARLSTQMIRREQYIEQLTSRMRSKADSLATDLATLDDHLESIESIVDRETTQPHDPLADQPKGSSRRFLAFVDAIVPPSVKLFSFVRPSSRDSVETEDTSDHSELTLSQIFREATAHHRPVADAARNLSKQLQQFLQNKKTIHY